MSIFVEYKAIKTSNQGSIVYRINNKGIRSTITSVIKIEKKHWNETKKEIRKSHSNSLKLNVFLQKERQDIEQAIFLCIEKNIKPTSDNLKARLKLNNLFNKTADPGATYQNATNDFLELKKNDVTQRTLWAYESTFKTIEIVAEINNLKLNFDVFTSLFYAKLLDYLYNTKGITTGGATKYATTIKSFLNWALQNNYHSNISFKNFKRPVNEPEIFPLTLDQIKQIESVALDDKLNRARDIFLFLIYTGLRFSDALKLKQSHIAGNYIRLQTGKTKVKLVIPIVKKTKLIIDKYQNTNNGSFLLPRLSNQKTNKYIKEVGRLANINNLISITSFQGNRSTTQEVARHEELTTHDGRRTFITQCLTKGMNAQMIMRITGHKKYSTFDRYVKFTDTDVLNQLKLVWNE